MWLREWSWDAQNYIEVEYPDEIVKDFVDKLRNNKQWWQSPDPGRDVYTSLFAPFQQRLADYRQTMRPAPSEPEQVADSPPVAQLSEAERAARARENRRAAMNRARAAKAAKAARAAPSG